MSTFTLDPILVEAERVRKSLIVEQADLDIERERVRALKVLLPFGDPFNPAGPMAPPAVAPAVAPAEAPAAVGQSRGSQFPWTESQVVLFLQTMVLAKPHLGKHGEGGSKWIQLAADLNSSQTFRGNDRNYKDLEVTKLKGKLERLKQAFKSKMLNPRANLSGQNGVLTPAESLLRDLLQEIDREKELRALRKEGEEKQKEEYDAMDLSHGLVNDIDPRAGGSGNDLTHPNPSPNHLPATPSISTPASQNTLNPPGTPSQVTPVTNESQSSVLNLENRFAGVLSQGEKRAEEREKARALRARLRERREERDQEAHDARIAQNRAQADAFAALTEALTASLKNK